MQTHAHLKANKFSHPSALRGRGFHNFIMIEDFVVLHHMGFEYLRGEYNISITEVLTVGLEFTVSEDEDDGQERSTSEYLSTRPLVRDE